MKRTSKEPAATKAEKIAALVRTLRETEAELQALTRERLDCPAGGAETADLISEARPEPQPSKAILRELSAIQGAILDVLPAHIALLDSQGIIVAVNEAWRRFGQGNGLQGSDFGIGQNYVTLCESVQGDGAAQARLVASKLREILAGTIQGFWLDYACHSPTEQRWFRLIVSTQRKKLPGKVVLTHIDITSEKLAEQRLVRINQLYAVLSSVNEVIVRTQHQHELFELVCRIAVDAGLFRMAAVMVVEEATGSIHPLTHAGVEEGYFSEVAINLTTPELSRGTVGTAVRTKAHNVCNDTLNDPRMSAWRESFRQHGFLSTASFPILIGEKVTGVLVLFAGEANYFGDDEVNLLMSVQKNLSFAVESLHKQANQRRAETALAAAQRQQKLILQSVGEGIQGLDADGRIVFENRAAAAMFGWREEEMRGKAAHELIHHHRVDGREYPLEECPIYQTLRDGQTRRIENEVFCRKDGTFFPVEYVCSPVRDEAGAIAGVVVCFQDVSEERMWQEQLARGTRLLSIAGRAARLGGWAIELPEGKLIWSDETCILHDLPPGYQPSLEEGVGYFPAEHRMEVMRHVEACAREGTPYDFEVPKNTARGRRIWVRCIGEAVRDAGGKIIRLQGAFQDVTDRKQAELALYKSNRALRMLSACGVALTHIRNEKELLSEVCRVAVEIGNYRMAWVGYALDDEGRSIQPMAHAGVEQGYLAVARITWSEDNPTGRGPAGLAIRTGRLSCCVDVEVDEGMVYWRKEALERGYRSIVCLPLRDDHRTFGLLGLYSGDIFESEAEELKLFTELADDLSFGINSIRSRAERRIAQQKIAEQAELLEKATDAIFVRDLGHRIVFWNKSAERVYGWKAEEVIGRSTMDFLHPDLKEYAVAVQVLHQKGEWGGELRKSTRAGQTLTLDCRWTLVRDKNDAPHSVLCIETDVTERKKLEAQIFRAQRMESIGILAGGIAHDLNNLLAPIMISIRLLRRDAKDGEAQKIINTLEACSQRGAALVRQVLSFARGLEGQRTRVDLKSLLAELQLVMQEIFPRNIGLQFVLNEGIRAVSGDPTQLHQVFLNLCVNARDAMPDGGRLNISMENVVVDENDTAANPDSKTGEYVMVSVSDSGTGIAPGILDKIFEPFFTTKEQGKGTGLGLSTVLGIVKSHGGFIKVHSEPGHGTKFKVYLPARAVEPPPEIARTNPPGLLHGKGELILLVDDEPGIREIAGRTLERFGYRVQLAGNGAEAVAIYAQRGHEIALVVTDVSMPVMDGASLVLALKSINPQVRILVSSGLTTGDFVAKARDEGIHCFLPKPYTAEALLKALQQELAGPATA